MDDSVSKEATHRADQGRSARPPAKASAIIWGAIAAILSAIVIWIIFAFATAGPRLPEIDQTQLDAARATWKKNGPDDYEITVDVSGTRAAVYRVEVRGGKAIQATRDGAPLTDPRTLGTWSVPGMFDTMQSDVDHIDEPIPISAKESHHVSPRAEFHPELGYPVRYRRIEWGSSIEVGWEVKKFTPVPSELR